MHGKPLVLTRTKEGCIVPTLHKLNQDGYYRTGDPRDIRKGRKRLIMMHRYVCGKGFMERSLKEKRFTISAITVHVAT